MARYTAFITPLQKDKEAFGRLCDTIKKITAHKLDSYGRVSYVTIYKYMKGEPVADGIEDNILDSIEDHYKAMEEKGNRNIERAKQIIAQ